MTIHVYRAYGLSCTSKIEIPGLSAEPLGPSAYGLEIEISPNPPDWVQQARNLPRFRRQHDSEVFDPSCTLTGYGADEYFELKYSDGTQFFVNGSGNSVWGTFVPPLTLDDFAIYLRGPVMGLVLRRRGVTALHAAAVSIQGRAVLLCGPSECGKSSTAAALATRRIPILSEDISAITEREDCFKVEPGYPRVCLWPDMVESLFGATEALPRLTPTWEKRFLRLDGQRGHFQKDSQRLGAVYLFGGRAGGADTPRLEEIGLGMGAIELVQNTYLNWTLSSRQRAAEFDMIGKIAAQVPLRRIVPHVHPSRLNLLCDLILADAGELLARNLAAPWTQRI